MIKKIKKKFFPDKIAKMEQDVESSFGKVSKDISHMKEWIMYLHSKAEHHTNTHNYQVEISKKEFQNMSRWIEHLKEEHSKMRSFTTEISKYIIELHQGFKHLNQKVSELEKSKEQENQREYRERTIEDIKGQEKRTIKDNKGQQKEEQQKNQDIDQHHMKVVDRNSLSTSQKELLHILYHTEEPLEYSRIAELLNKKEKSVRNLIYEIREQGINIRDSHIGYRKKGFYLDQAEKLKVSGR